MALMDGSDVLASAQRYDLMGMLDQCPVRIFSGSVPQFAALVEIDGALEGMVRASLVYSDNSGGMGCDGSRLISSFSSLPALK